MSADSHPGQSETLRRSAPATKADVARDWITHPVRRWKNRRVIRAIKKYQREVKSATL